MKDIHFSVALAVAFGVGLFLYLIRAYLYGRARNLRADQYGGSIFVGKGFLEFGIWFTSPLVSLLARLKVTPDQVTLLALIPAFFAGVAMAYGSFGLGAFLSLIAAVSDSIDGVLARRVGMASNAGEVLDATADRYGEFFLLAGLVLYYRFSMLLCCVVLLALLGSFMISYSTAKAEALGVTPPRGLMRRAERAIYLTFGAMLTPFATAYFGASAPLPWRQAPLLAALVLVGIVANYSAVVRTFTVVSRIRQNERTNKRVVSVSPPTEVPQADAAMPSAEVEG